MTRRLFLRAIGIVTAAFAIGVEAFQLARTTQPAIPFPVWTAFYENPVLTKQMKVDGRLRYVPGATKETRKRSLVLMDGQAPPERSTFDSIDYTRTSWDENTRTVFYRRTHVHLT